MKLSNALLTFVLCTTGLTAQADNIELNKADSRLHSKYGYQWQSIEIEALVDDVSYEKAVTLHYKGTDQQWRDVALTYRGEANSGQELWGYTLSQTLTGPYTSEEPLNIEFALKYEVNGQTYWDNNNAQNYVLAAGSGEFTAKPIVVDASRAQAPYDYNYNGNTGSVPGRFSVDFIVPNWGYEKTVEVHYSLDNWATSYVGFAAFQAYKYEGYSSVRYPNANNMEIWTFRTSGPEVQVSNAEDVQFAVKYSVNGATYWNNNQGENFRAHIQ